MLSSKALSKSNLLFEPIEYTRHLGFFASSPGLHTHFPPSPCLPSRSSPAHANEGSTLFWFHVPAGSLAPFVSVWKFHSGIKCNLLTVCVDVRREGTLSAPRRKPSRLTEKRVRERPRVLRLSDAIKRVESTVELVHAGLIEQKVS